MSTRMRWVRRCWGRGMSHELDISEQGAMQMPALPTQGRATTPSAAVMLCNALTPMHSDTRRWCLVLLSLSWATSNGVCWCCMSVGAGMMLLRASLLRPGACGG
eukprot:4815121-Pleurochrysis_carterae.AAC.1